MTTPITITEILGRAEQGMTRPFVCRAEDSETYFVKGAYAGLRSLCCEWVANRLAQLVLHDAPLRVPQFRMAEVPRSLIQGSARKDARDLGEGLVFASHRINEAQELQWSAAQDWQQETTALLLLLDLWLQNEDRSLSELGGNPNLLVAQTESPAPENAAILWAFDFNLAFDANFSRERFFSAHVFKPVLHHWPEGFRSKMEPKLRKALNEARSIFAELPLEWLHVDGDDTLPVQLDVDRVYSALELPFSEPTTFWSLS